MAALATHWAGLSMALGALLAGILLADSAFRHQVAAEIEPFRGLLLGLFFMTIGMLLQTEQIRAHWMAIALLVPCLILVKAAILFPLTRWLLLSPGPALRLALVLAQGGEFALVLFGEALKFNLLPGDLQHILVISVTISMMLTPALAWLAIGSRPASSCRNRGGRGRPALPAEGYRRSRRSSPATAGSARLSRAWPKEDIRWSGDRQRSEQRQPGAAPRLAGDHGDAGLIEAMEVLGLADAKAMTIAITHADEAVHLVALSTTRRRRWSSSRCSTPSMPRSRGMLVPI